MPIRLDMDDTEYEIRKAMLKRGLTMKALTEQVGKSRAWVSATVNGPLRSRKTLRAIYKALRIPQRELPRSVR